MGIFDKIVNGIVPRRNRLARMLNGYTPIFSQFGQDIYASDVVQQAIMCIVSEMKKLNPCHVRQGIVDVQPVTSPLQTALNNPNPLMTTSDFLEKVTWNLFFNCNSWIIPVFDTWTDEKGTEHRLYRALYPVQPTMVEFQEGTDSRLYVKLAFANNYETVLPYDEVIHIRHKFSVNEFMGGNKQGQPDNEALLRTLELNDTLLKGVASAMKASYALNAVVKFNTMMDKGKTEAALKELEEKLLENESGFLPLDLKSEFIPMERKVNIVDTDVLKFIDEKILRHYGVPLPILTGDYTKEQYEAFYQKTLEPLIKAFSEAFTKTLFTQREKSYGNKIVFYPKDLIFMSVDQTLEMVRLLGDSGALFENEKRVAFGLRPLPELVGVRMQSLNYVDVNIANKYQVGSDSSESDKKDEDDKNIDDDKKTSQNESGDESDMNDGGEDDEKGTGK